MERQLLAACHNPFLEKPPHERGWATQNPDVGGGWKGEEYSREEGSQDSWAQREGQALRKAAGREGDKEDP